MRRALVLATLTLVGATALAGCRNTDDATSDLPRPSRDFCEAAARYDERVTTARLGISGHIDLVAAIAANAPEDIDRDAQTFLDALQRRRDGDMSVVDDPEIEDAANRVLRRAGQDCGWYQRKGM